MDFNDFLPKCKQEVARFTNKANKESGKSSNYDISADEVYVV